MSWKIKSTTRQSPRLHPIILAKHLAFCFLQGLLTAHGYTILANCFGKHSHIYYLFSQYSPIDSLSHTHSLIPRMALTSTTVPSQSRPFLLQKFQGAVQGACHSKRWSLLRSPLGISPCGCRLCSSWLYSRLGVVTNSRPGRSAPSRQGPSHASGAGSRCSTTSWRIAASTPRKAPQLSAQPPCILSSNKLAL